LKIDFVRKLDEDGELDALYAAYTPPSMSTDGA
jgi:hypothetical protein